MATSSSNQATQRQANPTSVQSASQILAAATCNPALSSQTATSNFEASTLPAPQIHTGLEQLDEALREFQRGKGPRTGLRSGSCLEIIGHTATGKTTLAAQVAARWAVATLEDDSQSRDRNSDPLVLILDTEASLGPERIHQAVLGVWADKQKQDLPESGTKCATCSTARPLISETLDRMRYIRCASLLEFIAMLQILADVEDAYEPESHPMPVLFREARRCLIVIDSMAEFLRASVITAAQRKERTACLRVLREFAETMRARGVSLVVTNTMTMKLVPKVQRASSSSSSSSSSGFGFRRHDKDAILAPQVNVVNDYEEPQGFFGINRKPRNPETAEMQKWESALGKHVCRVLLRWLPGGGEERLAQVLPRLDSLQSDRPDWKPDGFTMFTIDTDGKTREDPNRGLR